MAEDVANPTIQLFAWIFFTFSVLIFLLADEPPHTADSNSSFISGEGTNDFADQLIGDASGYVLSLPDFPTEDKNGPDAVNSSGCMDADYESNEKGAAGTWSLPEKRALRQKLHSITSMTMEITKELLKACLHSMNVLSVLMGKLLSMISSEEVMQQSSSSLKADGETIVIEIQDEDYNEDSVDQDLPAPLELQLDFSYFFEEENQDLNVEHGALLGSHSNLIMYIWRQLKNTITQPVPFLAGFDSVKFFGATTITLLAVGLVFKPIINTLHEAVEALETRNVATEQALLRAKAKERELKALLRKVLLTSTNLNQVETRTRVDEELDITQDCCPMTRGPLILNQCAATDGALENDAS